MDLSVLKPIRFDPSIPFPGEGELNLKKAIALVEEAPDKLHIWPLSHMVPYGFARVKLGEWVMFDRSYQLLFGGHWHGYGADGGILLVGDDVIWKATKHLSDGSNPKSWARGPDGEGGHVEQVLFDDWTCPRGGHETDRNSYLKRLKAVYAAVVETRTATKLPR